MNKPTRRIRHNFAFALLNSFATVFLLLGLSADGRAQSGNTATDGFTPEGLKTGAPAGSFQLSGFDNINYFNGNLNFSLPLLGIGGRGSAAVGIPLRIEHKWRVIKTPHPGGPAFGYVNTPEPNSWQSTDPGYGPGILLGRSGGQMPQSCQVEQGQYEALMRLTFTAGDGTEYELRDVSSNNGNSAPTHYSYCSITFSPNRGKVFVSADGNAVTFISDVDIYDSDAYNISQIYPSGYMLMADGSRYRIDGGYVMWIRDRNGNKVSFTYSGGQVASITDSLNRQITIAYLYNGSQYYDVITYKGFGGATRTITVWHQLLSLALRSGYSQQTFAQLFPELNGSSSTPYDEWIVSSVVMPDNRSYQFKYNPYGELARVELPTGGAIEYDYLAAIVGGAASGTYGGGGQFIDKQVYRRVSERRVYLDKNSSTVSYKTTISRPEDSSGGNLGYVDVENKDSAGTTLFTKERHYYFGSAKVPAAQAPTDYSPWKPGKEWKTESFASNGTTTLQRAENTWQQPAYGYTWPLTVAEPSDTVRNNNPKVTQTLNTLVDTNQVSKQTFAYDAHFNQTDAYEFDFGSGAAPTYASRHTHTDFLTTNSVNSINYAGPANGSSYTTSDYHIRALPSKKIVYSVNPANGVETRVSQADIEYDRYDASAYHAGLVARANISGLDSTYASTGTVARGNATKTTSYSDAAGLTGAVSVHQQYDVAGNVVVAIDAKGISTTFEFADRYGSPDGDARANTAPSELAGLTSYAFATKITNTLGHTAYTQLSYYMGKPVDGEDPNQIKSSIYYNDTLDRPTKLIRAVSTSSATQMVYVYDDPNKTVYTYADKDTFGESGTGGGIRSAAKYDGLGRTWRKAAWEGSTWSITETQFDEIGRVKKTSNPFCTANLTDAAPSPGEWTTTTYDGVGRVVQVSTPDSAHVDSYYWGNMVRVDDQATKKRISQTNALGQLTSVWEVTPSDAATVNVTFNGTVFAAYQSTYLYNGLSSLAKVTQGAQNRYFMYDSLSRLIRAKNVEQSANASIALSDTVTGNSQWSMAYSYDANGNMLTRVDARNVTTTYGYDDLNRNTAVSYNDGVTPGLNRYYDGATNGKGRFQYNVSYNAHPVTGAAAYSFTQVNSYDALGRVTSQTQNFLNTGGTWTPYTSSRTYNLASNVLTQTYPSNRTATYGYNATAQLTSFTGTLGDGTSRNYATGITYTAAGLMSRETFGMQASTLYHNLHYNNRLQLVDIRMGDSSTDEWSWTRGALVYYYGTTARDSWNAFANSADNNGNVLRQVNYAPLSGGGYEIPQLDDYNYDALNRNTSVTEAQQNSAGTWTFNLFTQNFGYDRWGNRTVSCSPCQSGVTGDTFTVDTATNRITAKNGTGMTYDSAGNQTYDATGNRWFDGENRMHKATQGSVTSHYVYDADGKRVRRIIGSTETWMVYGLDGELVAEYAANGASGSPQKEYGYRGGQMLIVAQTSPLEIRWTVTDHLGTPRMSIMGNGASGGLLSSVKRHDYLPFGEELVAGVGLRSSSSHGYEPPSDGVRQKFTEKERDTETGLDYFGARYFGNTQGRFTSPDPYNIILEVQATSEINPKKAKAQFASYLFQPQQWNRYAYSINSPLKYIDPTGERIELVGTPEERQELFKRVQDVVGPEAAKLLFIKEECGHFYVEYNGKQGQGDRLAATSELGVWIADLIDSKKTTEFMFGSNDYKTKNGTFSLLKMGGAATVGAEESLTGNTQVIVHRNVGNMNQSRLGSSLLGASLSNDGRPLEFYNDIVDAHEFGHAYGNVIRGTPLKNSISSNYYALWMENFVRERRGLPNRRERH